MAQWKPTKESKASHDTVNKLVTPDQLIATLVSENKRLTTANEKLQAEINALRNPVKQAITTSQGRKWNIKPRTI